MNTQRSAIEPVAQGDGDPAIFDLGTLPRDEEADAPTQAKPTKRLLHTEKRGPAFQSVKSLQADTATAIGELFNAIDRHCLLDTLLAWTRLTRLLNVQFTFRVACPARDRWFWQEVQQAVVQALCYSETDTAAFKWHTADALLRAQAVEEALRTEVSLADPFLFQGAPDLADIVRKNLETYRDFAEGRL
jgi:hypothetical protein